MALSRFLKQVYGVPLLVYLVTASAFLHTAHAQQPAPEQDRQALVEVLRARMPGTQPLDWSSGNYGTKPPTTPDTVATAIPFNDENATNNADFLAIGKKLWDRKFKDGKSFALCFPNGGKRVAVTYPQYDTKTKAVVTLETAINRCLELHGEPPVKLTAEANGLSNMGALTAYLRSLSDGQKISIRAVPPAAQEKLGAGKTLFTRRYGQGNLACASCHVLQAGTVYTGKDMQKDFGKDDAVKAPVVLSPAIGQVVSWPRLQPGGAARTLQMQYQICMKRVGAEPFELGSDELNTLEYYHTMLSNGLPIRGTVLPR